MFPPKSHSAPKSLTAMLMQELITTHKKLLLPKNAASAR